MDSEENLPRTLRKYVSADSFWKNADNYIFKAVNMLRDFYYANIDELEQDSTCEDLC